MPSRFQPACVQLRSFVFAFFAAILLCIWVPAILAQEPSPRPAPLRRAVIVDTDAGADDLMALAFLLSRPDIHVEAVTIENGMAHVPAGGTNVLRLLALAGHSDIPVYLGRESPLSGDHEFPAPWRKASDELPGITLPETSRAPESRDAQDYLLKRLLDAAHPVQVLALGPLTNLGEVFSHTPRAARTGRQLVILGGAVGVSGNLGDGGLFQTTNGSSEWNLFLDPAATKIVFNSGAPIRLVPLDATQRVPIDMALYEQIKSRAETPLAKFVAEVLATKSEMIRQGYYFAQAPLAATALANPAVVTFRPMAIEISEQPDEAGRTVEVKAKNRRANAQVAMDADNLRFRDVFMTALGVK
ncbi:MAG TPA: nucleoside hydrolase [Candidatus Acidoferrales bacterium]|nr:nucleoside hydrolase [Candidatus Acidoferrales bacterium]